MLRIDMAHCENLTSPTIEGPSIGEPLLPSHYHALPLLLSSYCPPAAALPLLPFRYCPPATALPLLPCRLGFDRSIW